MERRGAVRDRLDELAAAIGRQDTLPDEARGELAGHLAALRESLEQEREAEGERRNQLSHDLRVPLNAIAGWTHILRLEASTPDTVRRAVDVFDRNVRALTRLIETYGTEPPR
jgi:signal transduction histidine kinase